MGAFLFWAHRRGIRTPQLTRFKGSGQKMPNMSTATSFVTAFSRSQRANLTSKQRLTVQMSMFSDSKTGHMRSNSSNCVKFICYRISARTHIWHFLTRGTFDHRKSATKRAPDRQIMPHMTHPAVRNPVQIELLRRVSPKHPTGSRSDCPRRPPRRRAAAGNAAYGHL